MAKGNLTGTTNQSSAAVKIQHLLYMVELFEVIVEWFLEPGPLVDPNTYHVIYLYIHTPSGNLT